MDKLTTLIAGFCFALTVSGATAAPQAPSQQAKTGTIIGHVRDTAGKPLAYIPVEIMQTGETAETNKEGAYVFSQEDAGAYTLVAIGNVCPAVNTRTAVETYSRVVMAHTLKPGDSAVMDFFLKPLDTRWVYPHPSPILKDYSGPGTAPQSQQEDIFQNYAGLHSTVRSR